MQKLITNEENIMSVSTNGTQGSAGTSTNKTDKRPMLYKFASFKNSDIAYNDLLSLCLTEDWDRFDLPGGRPHQLLRSYLESTFVRLEQEGKVYRGEEHAAFNTGLVDEHYNDIFALFRRNNRPDCQKWVIDCFVRQDGSATFRRMCDEVGRLPERASYKLDGDSLIFDVDRGLDLNHYHIIRERAFRLPIPFLRSVLSGLSEEARLVIDRALGCDKAQDRESVLKQELLPLFQDMRLFGAVRKALDDARDRTLQRIRLNYTVAVPHYYPAKKQFGFILPLYLVYEEVPDCILLVHKDRRASGYFGATILPPERAVTNSRSIMRPCESWLAQLCQEAADDIKASVSEEEMLTPVIGPDDKGAGGAARVIGMGVDREIEDGDTIGYPRHRQDEEAPNIALEGAESAWGISQIHGTFWLSRGQWRFISKGRNGTCVRRAGGLERLQNLVPFTLRTGDELLFGDSSPLRFVDATIDDDNTPVLQPETIANSPLRFVDATIDDDNTPVLQPEVIVKASLQGNGVECTLTTGMTIGCERNPLKPSPDIVVPVSNEINRHVSQLHGRFDFVDGKWLYTQLGRNGSVIVRGSERTQLIAASEPYALENGDNIILSQGAQAITFFC